MFHLFNLKKTWSKVTLAFILVTFLIPTFNVHAETPKAQHQPYMHGYSYDDIIDWSPDTDPYAKYFRSRVPLNDRIDGFRDTQANPNLDMEAECFNLAGDYDTGDPNCYEEYKYNDSYCRYLMNYWQYIDYYSSWHGAPVPGQDVPFSQAKFGFINLPNPAYTDAAHRNGAKSLGCWFWPRKNEDFSLYMKKNEDGSFPIADKMIEMAEYFGFDGYFINQEASIYNENAQLLMEFLKYMQKQAPEGFYLQWYDSLSYNGYVSYQNTLNSYNAGWLIDPLPNGMKAQNLTTPSNISISTTTPSICKLVLPDDPLDEDALDNDVVTLDTEDSVDDDAVVPDTDDSLDDVVTPDTDNSVDDVVVPDTDDSVDDVVAPDTDDSVDDVVAPDTDDSVDDVVAPDTDDSVDDVVAPDTDDSVDDDNKDIDKNTLTNRESELVTNSMFINYAWYNNRPDTGIEYAKRLGLDPRKVCFFGLEGGKYKFKQQGMPDLNRLLDENGKQRASISILGSDFVWSQPSVWSNANNKFDPNKQDEAYERERIFWSGPKQDPTQTGRIAGDPEYNKWDGLAHYIAERSVIGSFPFISRFNTGHGTKFFLDGKVTNENEWCNASIQDILPTWQWWTDSNGNALKPEFDYTDAYNGGSSLKVSGLLNNDNATDLRLFKTHLNVKGNEKLTLTYKTGIKNSPTNMKVGLIFEDDPTHFEYLDVGNSIGKDWNTTTFYLDRFTGRTIATIGLRFESDNEEDYTINIGELALLNNDNSRPNEPTEFKVDQVYSNDNDAEVFLSWDFDTSNVWYYNIYRVNVNNSKDLIGRMYDEVYYIKHLPKNNDTTTTLELRAVGFNGKESNGAQTTVNWN